MNLLCYRCGSKTGERNGGSRRRSVPRDTLITRTWAQGQQHRRQQSWRRPYRIRSHILGSASGNRSKEQVPQDWLPRSAWAARTLRCLRATCYRAPTSATTHHRIISRVLSIAGLHPHYFLRVSATSLTTLQLQRPARSKPFWPTSRRHSALSCRVRTPSVTATSTLLPCWPLRQPWRHLLARCRRQRAQGRRQTSTEGVPASRLCGSRRENTNCGWSYCGRTET
jgi:hypothetical protein